MYGGGTFGQQLMKRLVKDRSCVIAGWVDDDYWEYRRCCLNVDPISSVTKLDYDFVLVASLDRGYVANVTSHLKDYGVSENQILFVDVTKEEREKVLEVYLQ